MVTHMQGMAIDTGAENAASSILFVHNTAMPYRLPLFTQLSKRYRARFIFTNLKLAQTSYRIPIDKILADIEKIDYIDTKKSIATLIKEEIRFDGDVIIDSLESKTAILSLILARIRNKKIAFWTEYWGRNDPGIKWRFHHFKLGTLAKLGDAVLVPGTPHRRFLNGQGVDDEKIFTFTNASETSIDAHFEKMDENEKIILFVGRLIPKKGAQDLIEALTFLPSDMPPYQLVIIGEGPYRKTLEQLSMTKGLKEQVSFLGYVDEEELHRYYAKCAVCVIPSTSNEGLDPWVFIVNEAESLGKPVIVTNAIGAHMDMVIDGSNGFVVSPNSPREIAIALKKILSNDDVQTNMGLASLEMIKKKYNYDVMLQDFDRMMAYIMK